MKKLCKSPGCPNYRLDDHSYCEKHLYKEEDKNRSWSNRKETNPWRYLYNSRRWIELRDKTLRDNPYCALCGRPSEEVHHIAAHRGNEELFYDEDNLVALCHDCHTQETLKEIRDRRNNNGC